MMETATKSTESAGSTGSTPSTNDPTTNDIELPKHSLQTLIFKSVKRSHDLFLSDYGSAVEIPLQHSSVRLRLDTKFQDEYAHLSQQAASITSVLPPSSSTSAATPSIAAKEMLMITGGNEPAPASSNQRALAIVGTQNKGPSSSTSTDSHIPQTRALALMATAPRMPKPDWHAPWKLMRVISSHTGWVRCVAVDPTNQWFATGSVDRMIKIWDLASGTLKLSLTGHTSTVRGLAVSPRHPYLFSASEDKTIKCWDLETNKVIRHYHGHTASVYCLSLHPTLDVLVSGGRDAAARVWDMRTKACVHVLTGHKSQIDTVQTQAADPQVITGSADSTVRLWDLAAGKTRTVLTNHKKSVRSIAIHPTEFSFVSGAADSIKQWRCPDGMFLQNFEGHNAVINSVSVNADGVLMSGGDNGTLFCWDYRTGYNFQQIQSPVQPGSLDSEAGIFASTFDMSGARFITCEADKSIKMYREDDTATEETHPLNWRPGMLKHRF